MKSSLVALTSSVFGSGLFAGNLVFDSTLRETTINQVLEENSVSLLNLNGDEESWLVLAQQYRENGTTQRFSTRNVKEQENPDFLDIRVWNKYADKNIGFEKDEEIAGLLKKECAESLDKQYSPSLYSHVLNWCKLDLPEYIKKVLQIQKENGDCRFWLIKSSQHKTGWYPWEAVGQSIDSVGGKLFLLKEHLLDPRNKNILEQCALRKHKILELSWTSVALNNADKSTWELNKEWTGEIHKLAIK